MCAYDQIKPNKIAWLEDCGLNKNLVLIFLILFIKQFIFIDITINDVSIWSNQTNYIK